MELLKTLRPVRMNGEIVLPGQTIKVIDGRGLIDKGYARRLTKDEIQAILTQYKKCAEDLFSETPEERADERISIKRNDEVICQGQLF
jgi:hypothetical protein